MSGNYDCHEWAWLGNVAIAAKQCVYCKELQSYHSQSNWYDPCPKRNKDEICEECGGVVYKCRILGHINGRN